jgi:hypothetical protein
MTRDKLDAETHAFLCDETRLQRFRDGLQCGHRRTIPQAAVWSAFSAAYSDLPSGPERRVWLLAVLEELVERGAIQLPVRHGKQWDRSSEIVLPTSITLVNAAADRDALMQWRRFPWHPSLQWVLQLRTLAPDQVTFLMRVNEGLVEGWFAQQECVKYRSLQLTGDEKRLESLIKGMLFGPGCLTLEMLGCEPDALPLATEHLSSQTTMLIFENAAPFMLARSVAANTVSPRIGRLAYGAGKQVLKAFTYFSMIEPALKEVLYIGDLDAEGLKIAADLQRLSKSVAVRPAHEFHCAMLESAIELGAPDGWPVRDDQPLNVTDSTFSIVAPDIRQKVATLIEAGRRIPEEVLTRAAMSRLLRES